MTETSSNGNISVTNGSKTLKPFISNFQSEDGETEQVVNRNHGIGVLVTVALIVSVNTAINVVGPPLEFVQPELLILPLVMMCFIDVGICAILIGKCRLILEERWPEFQLNCHYSYPAIGQKAYGNWMRLIVTFCHQLSLFCTSAMILFNCILLVYKATMQYFVLPTISWFLIIGFIATPFMLFGSPKKIWFVAIASLSAVLIVVTLVLIEIAIGPIVKGEQISTTFLTKNDISITLLIFILSFGGTAAFPTFQNYMRDKSKFTRSVVIGFSILLIFFLVLNLTGEKSTAIVIMLSVHCLCAFIILVNSAVQEIEEKLKVTTKFGWKRLTVRMIYLILVLFITLFHHAVKRFFFMGGSAVTMLAYILPPLSYMKLCSMQNESWQERKVTILEKIYYFKIMIIGVIGVIFCTYLIFQ